MDITKSTIHFMDKSPKLINDHTSKPGTNINKNKFNWPSSQLQQKVFSYQYDMVSVFSIQGKRATMEDKFRVVQQKSPFSILIFGVFDGHGGNFAVEYVESKLIPNILNSMNHYLKRNHTDIGKSNVLSFIEKSKKYNSFHLSSTERSILYNQILNQEIIALDKLLLQKADSLNNNSGTTCLIGILFEGDLVFANTGDCRAIMCDSKGRTIQLTVDHKPQNSEERERIRKAGGFVTLSQAGIWRLNGILSVSRGFGDLSLKRFNNVITVKPDIHIYSLLNPPDLSNSSTVSAMINEKKSLPENGVKDTSAKVVSPTPSSSSSRKPKLSGPDSSSFLKLEPRFLVLASDGLWNSMSNTEVTEFLLSSNRRKNVHNMADKVSTSYSPSTARKQDPVVPLIDAEADFGARALSLEALRLGSTDNVTVMILKFDLTKRVAKHLAAPEKIFDESHDDFYVNKISDTEQRRVEAVKQRRNLTPDILNGKISFPAKKTTLEYPRYLSNPLGLDYRPVTPPNTCYSNLNTWNTTKPLGGSSNPLNNKVNTLQTGNPMTSQIPSNKEIGRIEPFERDTNLYEGMQPPPSHYSDPFPRKRQPFSKQRLSNQTDFSSYVDNPFSSGSSHFHHPYTSKDYPTSAKYVDGIGQLSQENSNAYYLTKQEPGTNRFNVKIRNLANLNINSGKDEGKALRADPGQVLSHIYPSTNIAHVRPKRSTSDYNFDRTHEPLNNPLNPRGNPTPNSSNLKIPGHVKLPAQSQFSRCFTPPILSYPSVKKDVMSGYNLPANELLDQKLIRYENDYNSSHQPNLQSNDNSNRSNYNPIHIIKGEASSLNQTFSTPPKSEPPPQSTRMNSSAHFYIQEGNTLKNKLDAEIIIPIQLSER